MKRLSIVIAAFMLAIAASAAGPAAAQFEYGHGDCREVRRSCVDACRARCYDRRSGVSAAACAARCRNDGDCRALEAECVYAQEDGYEYGDRYGADEYDDGYEDGYDYGGGSVIRRAD